MRKAEDYPNTVEFAAEKLHNAWMKEKLKQGFHAPKDCPSVKLAETDVPDEYKFLKFCDKCHTDLYPYSELPDNIKDYDRVTVIAVLDAVNYFEGKTCSDCRYFDIVTNFCCVKNREHEENPDALICEWFVPQKLVENLSGENWVGWILYVEV